LRTSQNKHTYKQECLYAYASIAAAGLQQDEDTIAMSDTTATPPAAAPPPTHADLFIAFLRITLSSIGAPLPWTRRMIVEKKRWMTAEEFNEIYALCQFLPGPNIVNLAAVFGSRMRGATGAVAAWSGFLALPFCAMLLVSMLYSQFGDLDALRRTLGGVAAWAAGLLIATFVKMATPLFRGFGPAPFLLLVTAVAIGIMRWPLLWVMVVLAPSSVALAWWGRR
jgi:chromate transporter